MAKPPLNPKVAVTTALALALAALGIWWWTSTLAPENTNLHVNGSVESTEYQVSSLVAAQIEEIKVEEGQQIKAGDELVLLDKKPLQLVLDQANEGVKAAKAALTNARNDGSKADIKAAKAKVAQAKAQVELAKIQLGYATITAPADGTVMSIIARAGQGTSPVKTLLTILDTSDIYASGYLPENHLGEIKLGQSAYVTSDSSTETYQGKVEHIASDAEFTPNTVQTKDQRTKLVYQIRVRISDETRTLKAGMPVDITFGE